MSCNCNSSYNNLPCCCSPTPVTPPVVVPCPDAIPCDEVIETDCVLYTGPTLDCYGITTGDSVTDILEILIAQLTTCVSCRTITLDPFGPDPVTFQYVPCGQTGITILTITTSTTVCCNINNSDFKISSGSVQLTISTTSC